MSYKIQNRTADAKRIKVIKRSDGAVTFDGVAMPTFQENTVQAGWCMSPITPLAELVGPTTTMELSACPIGVDGRVSIYRNGTLTSSMRYSNLKTLANKVSWFNDYFGAVVRMSMVLGSAIFTCLEDENTIMVVFEDDDMDYALGKLTPTDPAKVAFFREQYRLALAVKINEIDCTGAIDFAGILLFPDAVSGTVTNSAGSKPFATIDEMVTQVNSLGFEMVELQGWEPMPDGSFPRTAVEINEEYSFNDEPAILMAEITPWGQPTTTITGSLPYVMDRCQEFGILIQFDYADLRIGCEPNTPPTKIEISSGQITFNTGWKPGPISAYHNPTLEVFTDYFTATVGWDNAPDFLCHILPKINGAFGDVGDVITSMVDLNMRGTFAPGLLSIPAMEDYSEQCALTNDPLECCKNNQVDNYCAVANTEKLAGTGGRFLIRDNLDHRWTPEHADAEGMCTAATYHPVAIRYDVEIGEPHVFGYAIPEPKRNL